MKQKPEGMQALISQLQTVLDTADKDVHLTNTRKKALAALLGILAARSAYFITENNLDDELFNKVVDSELKRLYANKSGSVLDRQPELAGPEQAD